MRLAFLIPPMMLLAACGSEEKKSAEGTQVSINAGDEHGGVQIRTGKDGGNIKIGGGGAGIDIDIPDFVDLDIESDFDIDGVKLYPGSKVTKVDVDANDRNGADKATVKLGFTSPAAPTKAADWMASEFAKKGVKVTRSGDTLAGKDKDGSDFRINFAPDGANAKGEVVITKS
ncbi:MAG: hypothetical protein JHC57_20315 [Sphingopyxis sp.]|uniref:hypothetical protein n=1 Tax=Sphingopyxis sp. TaxID=1908224 RepID=UPI001A306AF1|nr:hypothetical protein [Sphingopyxis sp.]MBJ7502108.1 hypothetical protein [Sphingopyxis sp.]